MTNKDDLDEHELAELSKEVAKRLERRGVIQAGAGLAAGGAAGYLASGRAEAGSNQTGTIGSGGSPVDVVAEDIYGPGGQGSGDAVAFESLDTDQVEITDQSLIYVWGGEGNNLVLTKDPANFSDVFAAVNDVFTNLSDSEQVEIWLPYTGSAGVSISTTLELPSGQVTPNVRGYGADATVFDYVATDGTPAIRLNGDLSDHDANWRGFALNGPGSGAGGGGNGFETDTTWAHSTELSHIYVRNFPGDGFHLMSFFSAGIHHCVSEDNGGDGFYLNNWNGASLQDCKSTGNGGDQLRAEDPLAMAIVNNNIDAGGGPGTVGVRIEAVNQRCSAWIAGNYMENNDLHVIIDSTNIPNRGTVVGPNNRMGGGSIGVSVDGNVNRSYIIMNTFENVGSEDILLDGNNMVLGPNTHIGSTKQLTDNTAGNFDSLSQTAGSYPW